MNWLKKIPFFLLLLVLFFCLHGWLENYEFIHSAELLKPGLTLFCSLILLTGLIYLFAKNWLLASLVALFIGVWYIFFGAIHDWIKSIAMLSFIKSYTAMLVLLLLLTLGWIILLKRKRGLHHKLAMFINILLLIYCLIDIFLLVEKEIFKPAATTENAVRIDTSRVKQKPDVYLILLDGYPGFTSLADSFNFGNDSLRNYFSSRSFKLLPVFSNYDYTYFCMSSMFNMQYVKDDFDNLHLTPKDFQKRGVEINHSAVGSIFKSMRYAIENISIFEFDDKPPVSVNNSFLLTHSILVTDKLLHNRLKRDIGDRLGKFIPFWKNVNFYQHDIDNKLTEKLLLNTIAEKKKTPRFVYAHFMMPHGPYYYDSAGNKNPYFKISHFTKWNDKELFVSYLKYINARLIGMVDEIIRHNPNAIILLLGDHGFRSYGAGQVYQPARFDNLCAIRFPNNWYQNTRDQWSLVNLFPYVFNSQFGQHLPYLPDSSVVLSF